MSLIVSSSPHLNDQLSTKRIMREVIIALVPAGAAAVYFFRYRALFLIANCVISCIVAEAVICKIRKKPITLSDNSALLTGILLAFILPPSISWYAATLGSVFAIVVVKQLFGGLGANIFNPALMGRAFVAAAYPKMITTFILPFSVDAVSAATPLALNKFNHVTTPIKTLFWGNNPGSLGETSAICLLIGGVYLFLRKVADWRIPLSLLATVAVFSALYRLFNPQSGSVLFHLMSGGMLIGTFFMATDPVTSPVTKKGRYVFGICCGALIMVIRYFSGLPEGVMYAILFMNAFVPLINRYTLPRRFGT